MKQEWIDLKPDCDLDEFSKHAKLLINEVSREEIFKSMEKMSDNTYTCCHVLTDLHMQGWKINIDNNVKVAKPDIPKDRVEHKARVRSQEHVQREESLSKKKVRDFLNRMEPAIEQLMRDGRELNASLAEWHEGKKDIKEVIDPYIQFVDDGYCEETGLKLTDIYDYFRWTSSIDYRQRPGTNIRFLVRDRAMEGHPMIGILQFGSPPGSMSARDDFLCWRASSLAEYMKTLDDPKKFLLDLAEDRINYMYVDDIKDMSVEELKEYASDNKKKHYELSMHDPKYMIKMNTWKEKAESYLFSSRRASIRAKYLTARNLIEEHMSDNPSDEDIDVFLKKHSSGITAFAESLKFRHANHSQTEMVICVSNSP